MEIYKLDSIEQVSAELILNLVNRYKLNEVKRLDRLHNYYVAESDIRKRTMSDSAKPNNRIVTPYSSYIVDTVQGYFLGKPVAYNSIDTELLDKINEVYKANHEQAHNSNLAKEMSISGIAYELLYMNEDREISFASLDPRNTFMIYDTSIKKKPLVGVRFYDSLNYLTGETQTNIEYYTDKKSYSFVELEDGVTTVVEEPHTFNQVPVICYQNNDERMGDFEKVIDLIDAMDLAVSDTANNLEYFADSYLVLSNASGTLSDDIADMKENRVLLLPEGGKAEWLVKGTSNIEVEEYKDRLKDDIHTLSQVPNLNDEAFGTATSGESLKYKLFGLENIVAIKERNFKAGLEERAKLINNIFTLKGNSHSYTDLTMSFTRNLPINQSQLIDMIVKLEGIISHETILSLLPFIDDIALEMNKLENENKLYTSFPVDKQIEEMLEDPETAPTD